MDAFFENLAICNVLFLLSLFTNSTIKQSLKRRCSYIFAEKGAEKGLFLVTPIEKMSMENGNWHNTERASQRRTVHRTVHNIIRNVYITWPQPHSALKGKAVCCCAMYSAMRALNVRNILFVFIIYIAYFWCHIWYLIL